MDALEGSCEHDWAGPWIVTVTMASLVYGGPEEGGWWRNRWDPLDERAAELAARHQARKVFWDYAGAKAYADDLGSICTAANRDERRREKSSVASTGCYEPYIFEGWVTVIIDGPDHYE